MEHEPSTDRNWDSRYASRSEAILDLLAFFGWHPFSTYGAQEDSKVVLRYTSPLPDESMDYMPDLSLPTADHDAAWEQEVYDLLGRPLAVPSIDRYMELLNVIRGPLSDPQDPEH